MLHYARHVLKSVFNYLSKINLNLLNYFIWSRLLMDLINLECISKLILIFMDRYFKV